MRQVLDPYDPRLTGQRADHPLGVGPTVHLAADPHHAVDHLGGQLLGSHLESAHYATKVTAEKAVINRLEPATAQ